MKSKWRAYALVAIFLISVAAGLIWHFASRGLGESTSADSGPPFLLGVYTQSPRQPIKIELDLYYNSSGTFVDVFLNAPPNDNILVLGTQQDVSLGKDKPSSFKRLYHSNGSANYDYYSQATGGSPLPQDQRGYVIASFKVPDSTLTNKPEEVIAHLPLVGQDEDSTQYMPAAATINTDAGIYLNPTLRAGRKISDRTPAHYFIPDQPGSTVRNLYWNPEKLITEERVVGIGEKISGWNISDTPANGISGGGDYIWQGDYGLAGTLTAINPSAAESRASDEFYSGIALATAAAALIALLQEFKDTLPFRKTAGDSSSEEST
jgi:hypothetical protein